MITLSQPFILLYFASEQDIIYLVREHVGRAVSRPHEGVERRLAQTIKRVSCAGTACVLDDEIVIALPVGNVADPYWSTGVHDGGAEEPFVIPAVGHQVRSRRDGTGAFAPAARIS